MGFSALAINSMLTLDSGGRAFHFRCKTLRRLCVFDCSAWPTPCPEAKLIMRGFPFGWAARASGVVVMARLFRLSFGMIAAALCVALWSVPAAAQSLSRSGLPRDLQSIVDAKVLRVAVTRFDLPSFHVRGPNGRLLGPEIEMAQQIGRALDVRVEFLDQAESFDRVVDFVALGRADIGVSKLSQTYYRLKRVRFSQPYVTLRHALLFNRATIARTAAGRPPAAVLQKFKGRIGVIGGSAYVDFASRNFPEATVWEARNWNEAIANLLSGRVDAVYRDEFEIRRVLKNRPALNVRFGAAAIIDQKAFLSVAICDTCSKLQEFINYHIATTRGAFMLKGVLNSNLGAQVR
jgi:polar amino acid transport system substrate-binding protein